MQGRFSVTSHSSSAPLRRRASVRRGSFPCQRHEYARSMGKTPVICTYVRAAITVFGAREVIVGAWTTRNVESGCAVENLQAVRFPIRH